MIMSLSIDIELATYYWLTLYWETGLQNVFGPMYKLGLQGVHDPDVGELNPVKSSSSVPISIF